MNRISHDYAKWLSITKWTHAVTLRRHFPFTEMSAELIGERIITSEKQINKLFYSVERDRCDNMNHMHLILESNHQNLTRKDIAIAAGLAKNPKAVSYFQKAQSKDAVSWYTSKHVGKPNFYHGYQDSRFFI